MANRRKLANQNKKKKQRESRAEKRQVRDKLRKGRSTEEE